jgi:fibronectin type 3 domain-containing protein
MKRILALLALIPILSLAQTNTEPPIIDIDKGIKLAWDASPSTNIVHHRIRIGTESGNYTDGRLVDGRIPTATEPVVVMVETPGTYYIAVTAINDLGLESGPSNEVVVRVRSINTPSSPVIMLAESYEVVAITETTTTTRIIKEVKP